jgi:hypothetical protein
MSLLVAGWVGDVLSIPLELTNAQSLGLSFLLGSFAVATLSDLKRLSAQREFLEVWVLFTLGVFAYDGVVLGMADWQAWPVPAIKWALIAGLGLASWQGLPFGLFDLARADVFACTAAAALMTPVLVVVFWVVLKLVATLLRPVLSRGTGPWPFMPVVTVSVVVVLAAGLLLPGGEVALIQWLPGA